MIHKSKNIIFKVASLLLLTALGSAAIAQDHSQHQGQSKMGENRQPDMQTIHALFAEHQKINRTIKNIDSGVETLTESDDPKVQAMIKQHVAAMYKRLAHKQMIRGWDPLFAELFKHADKIKMEMTTTAKGIKVIETSDDSYVVKLIQAHAVGVSEFVKEGMSSMHKEHPLPDAKAEPKKFLGKGDGVTSCPVTGEPVDKKMSAEINGKTVYFCCGSCRDVVKKNPDLYLRP
jgi:YHS domain-containing protein/uncharacterized protein YdcH (DUF465 family)